MRRGIIYIDKNYAEFGAFRESRDNIRILFEGRKVWGISYDELKDHLGFDYLNGLYIIGSDKNVNKACCSFGGGVSIDDAGNGGLLSLMLLLVLLVLNCDGC